MIRAHIASTTPDLTYEQRRKLLPNVHWQPTLLPLNLGCTIYLGPAAVAQVKHLPEEFRAECRFIVWPDGYEVLRNAGRSSR